MKTITTSEECAACRDCCQFRAEKLYFAPVWTDTEIAALRAGSPAGQAARFHRYGPPGSRVWQIDLVPSAFRAGVWVCPLLDEPTNMCRVYGLHPFDCRIWPFLVQRQENASVHLAYVADPDCRGLKRACADAEGFRAYTRYLAEYLRRPETAAVLRAHPELIWPAQPNTVFLADLSDVLR